MKNNRAGRELMEILAATALLSLLAALVLFGAGFMRQVFNVPESRAVQWETQTVLYQISRDVRNADAIISIEEGPIFRIQLKTKDYSQGYDVRENPSIFQNTNISTVTYQYVPPIPDEKEGFLKRSVEKNGHTLSETIFLSGSLEQKLTTAPFQALAGEKNKGLTGVRLNFLVSPAESKKDSRRYETECHINDES